MSIIAYSRDDDGVVTLTIDDPDSPVNTMTDAFRDELVRTAARLRDEADDVTGVLVTSGKSTFFAGGNLHDLRAAGPDDAASVVESSMAMKRALRSIETLGVPVVACLDGSALGGGLEIALACHRRIASANPRTRIGCPEVTLGLLPGAGGVVRVTRMLGVVDGLTKVLVQGQQHPLDRAVEIGLVDEVVADDEAVLAAARRWIAEHPTSVQPWEADGYRVPGGTPRDQTFLDSSPAIPANLRKQLRGVDQHAPKAIVAVAVESLQVPVDRAWEVEARYFADLVCNSPQSRNMIQAFFFDMQAITRGRSRPEGHVQRQASRVVVLGAGMMGAGIAYQCAKVGLDVVLKDVDLGSARRGKEHAEQLVARGVERGRVTGEAGRALLDRITPTAEYADCAGADVVIEAVFESVELKHEVFAEVEQHVADDALLCTNTSTLPISELARGVSRPEDFIGLHYFSPVDRMPLIEIIRGERTSDATLARAFDLALQQRRTPIVVNDSRGFFTSRVIGTFLNEALAMVGEGVSPVVVERAGERAGYPAPPLQLTDELNLGLARRIEREAAAAAGDDHVRHPASDVRDRMLDEFDRPGRAQGAGFYEYDDDGRRTRLWPGLVDAFGSGGTDVPLQDAVDRMLFAEALETVRCFDEGVIETFPDANVGSILGIGFPAWTGGVAQFVDQYEGGTTGFVARCKELADRYGDRFLPPASLAAKAEQGQPLRPAETR